MQSQTDNKLQETDGEIYRIIPGGYESRYIDNRAD